MKRAIGGRATGRWQGWRRLAPVAAALPLIAMAALGRAEPAALPSKPPSEPYRLTATRSLDGAVTLQGAAPDRATRQRFLRAAGLVPPTEGGEAKTWTGALVGLALRDDAPDDMWTGRAHRALRAFALLSAGRLSLIDKAVVLEGRARSAEALDRIGSLVEPDWQASIWVAPAPPQLMIEIAPGGRVSGIGILPPGLERADLEAVVPGLEISAGGTAMVEGEETTDPLAPERAPMPKRADRSAAEDASTLAFQSQATRLATPAASKTWRQVMAALPLALPRIDQGRITLGPRRVTLSGRLKRGFSAADTRAALRTALRLATGGAVAETAMSRGNEGADNQAQTAEHWQFQIDLADAPPLSRLTIAFADGRLSLAGILPEGLDAETALVRGGGAERAGLTSGGAGDPGQWRRILDALAAVRDGIASAEGEATAERLMLAGRLQAGWTKAEVQARIADALGTPAGQPPPPTLELSLIEAGSSATAASKEQSQP
ncbi:MAG: hypothetical protein AAF416_17015 [Pseudomonadota bacterium]